MNNRVPVNSEEGISFEAAHRRWMPRLEAYMHDAMRRIWLTKRRYGPLDHTPKHPDFLKNQLRDMRHFDPEGSYADLPSLLYLERTVLGSIFDTCRTDEELDQKMEAALESVEIMTVSRDLHSAYIPDGDLIMRRFFHSDEEDGGDFEYFYATRGRAWAIAASAYRGLSQYPIKREQIEEHITETLSDIPEIFHNRVLQIFAEYAKRNSLDRALVAFRGVRVLMECIGYDQPRQIDNLLELLSEAPDMDSYFGKNVDNIGHGFVKCARPITTPSKVSEEMEALEANGEFTPALIKLAKLYMRSNQGSDSRRFDYPDHQLKFSKKEKAGNPDRYSHANIPFFVERLRAAGHSDEKIMEILCLPEKYPWLGSAAFALIHAYAESFESTEEHRPGGMEGLIRELENFKDYPQCMIAIIKCRFSAFGFKMDKYHVKWPLEVDERDHRILQKLIAVIGDHAASFIYWGNSKGLTDPSTIDGISVTNKIDLSSRIDPRRITSHAAHMVHSVILPRIVEPMPSPLQENTDDPETAHYERLIDFASRIASRFPEGKGDKVRRMVFRSLIAYCSDPHFTELEKGLAVLADAAREFFNMTEEGAQGPDHPLDYHIVVAKYFQRIMGGAADTFVYDKSSRDDEDKIVPLPDVFEYVDEARVLAQYYFEEHDYNLASYERTFLPLIESGIPMRIAAFIRTRFFDREVSIARVRGMEPLVGEPRLREIGMLVEKIRDTLRLVLRLDIKNRRLLKDSGYPDEQLVDSSMDDLKFVYAAIQNLREDPVLASYMDFGPIEDELAKALNLTLVRKAPHVITGSNDAGVRSAARESRILGSDDRQLGMTLSVGAYLAAAGLVQIPGVTDGLVPSRGELKQLLDGKDAATLSTNQNSVLRGIHERFPNMLRRLEQAILQNRHREAGLAPTGMKQHISRGFNPHLVRSIEERMGLGSTAFRLDSAGTTLVIQPFLGTLEAQLFTMILQLSGVGVQDGTMQLCTAGELEESNARLVAPPLLLSTTRGVRYAPGAFATSHNTQTGSHILIKGAGVKIHSLPFDNPAATNRTDVLGRRTIEDIAPYRTLATLARDREFRGAFAPVAERFDKRFMSLLGKVGLADAIDSASWVYRGGGQEAIARHEAMLRRFTDAWESSADLVDLGVIAQVQRLIHEAETEMDELRPSIIASRPDDYARLMLRD